VDGNLRYRIEKLGNEDFKVISASYGNPVVYHFNRRVQSRVERKRNPNHTTGYCYKYGIYRDNGG